MLHPWDFGWDALVAIGTLSLAAATFVLVMATYKVSKQGDREIRALSRPVVLLQELTDVRPESRTGRTRWPGIRYDGEGRFTITAKNHGPGPALNVMAWVQVGGGQELSDDSGGTMAPGDSAQFEWTELPIAEPDSAGGIIKSLTVTVRA
jgi:hypothetical protein